MGEINIKQTRSISRIPTESYTILFKKDDFKLIGTFLMCFCLEEEITLNDVMIKIILHQLSLKMEKKYIDVRHNHDKKEVKLKLSPEQIVALFLCVSSAKEEDVYLNTIFIKIISELNKLLV